MAGRRVQYPQAGSQFGLTPQIPVDGSCARGNAGFLAPGQSRLSVNVDQVSITSGQTVPLPAPPAGKMWVLTDLAMTHDQNASVRFALTNAGVVVWSTSCHGSVAPDLFPGLETQPSFPAGATPALVMGSASGGKGYVNLQGVIQPMGGG